MGGTNGFNDRKAEARAAPLARASAMYAEKSFEDARKRRGRNPHTRVGDLDQGLVLASTDRQINRTAWRRVFDGIVEQVHHHLFHSSPVTLHPDLVRSR